MKKVQKHLAIFLSIALIIGAFSIFTVSFAVDNEQTDVAQSYDENWVSAWSTSVIDVSIQELGEGVGMVGVPVVCVSSRVSIEPTMSGNKVRIVYSNEYGVLPLRIAASTVAQTDAENTKAIDTSTLTDITFSGKKSVAIPAGERMVSDAVDFEVIAGKRITINTFCRSVNVMKTVGLIGGDSYISLGNSTRKESVYGPRLKVTADSGAYEIIPMLAEVDVAAVEDASTCVIFGDSTVDNEVPRYLSAALRENGIDNVSVTQAAIKGNRLVCDGVGKFGRLLGEAGVDRFQKDVLDQAGVKSVIVKIGINDVIHPNCATKKGKAPVATYEDMLEGYEKLINACHERGIKIYLCEMSAWEGYTRGIFIPWGDVHWSTEIDSLRYEVNEWIRSKDCPADGYIVTDRLNDPDNSNAILPAYTTDGIHYTDEGTHVLTDIFYDSVFAE